MDIGIGGFRQGNIGLNIAMRRFKPKIFAGFLCFFQRKWGTKEKRDEEGWINDQGFSHRTMFAGNRDIIYCFQDRGRTRRRL
jgi:hypothetical protein